MSATDGAINLTWTPPTDSSNNTKSSGIGYTVYLMDVTGKVDESELSGPGGKLITIPDEKQPRFSGRSIAYVKDGTSYAVNPVEANLQDGSIYAFQVVATSSGQTVKEQGAVAVLKFQTDFLTSGNVDRIESYLGSFQSGATSVTAADALTARISSGAKPKSGQSVTFAITQAPAGATGHSLSVASGTTGADGTLSSVFTAGNKDGVYIITATWKNFSTTFIYFASIMGDLQNQINNLANPPVGNGSGVTPPVAVAVGVPGQPTSTTSYTFGVQDVESYKYVIVSSAIACADAVNGYSANWTPISTPISVAGLSQGEKRLCLLGKNGALVQQTATTYTWLISSAAPATFAIIAPSAVTSSSAPTLQWQAASGAASYSAKVASDASCSTVLQNYPVLVPNSQVLLPLADGIYYACVTAVSAAGIQSQASNDGYTFKVDASAPNTPAAPSTSGAYVPSTTLTFNWAGVTDVGPSGLSGYNLRVGTTAGGAQIYSGFVGLVTSYSVSGLVDGGAYYAQVQAIDAAGNTSNWSPSSTVTRVDVSLTSPATSLVTAASAANGPDVRYASSGSFFVAWSGAADTGSGLNSYTLVKYSQANCAGTSSTENGILSPSFNVTGTADGETYSFKVVAQDNVGNIAVSGCSGNITVLSTPPAALTSFTGSTGNLSGEINLSLTYPGSTSRYASVVIRRIQGATPPADCSSGVVARTLSTFSTTSYVDQTLGAGNSFSYRACITDFAGNVTSSNTISNIQAKVFNHRIFVTRNAFTGNLGGYTGADTICKNAAANAGLAGDHWKALISWNYNDAVNRAPILGPVYMPTGTTIATSKADFWDGTIATTLQQDEFGVSVGTVYVWASTAGAGTNQGVHCTDWTSTRWTGQWGGRTDRSNSEWIHHNNNVSCASQQRLYCINQVGPYFSAETGTGNTGDIKLSLLFPSNTTSYGKVTIRRLAGSVAPSEDCSSTGSQIALVTSFSDQVLNDATNVSAGFFSYRACLYDSANNLVTSSPVANIQAKGATHLAFVTSSTYTPDLGGLNGADTICKSHASSAGLPGDHWRAILSTSFNNIADRLTITGPIYRTDGQLLATGSADFWDGALLAPLSATETGAPYSGSAQSWTGSSASGLSAGSTCGNYTYTNGNYAQYIGNAAWSNTNWIAETTNTNCLASYHLMCINQAGPRFAVAPGTVNPGDITYSLTFPADTSTYGRVRIRRTSGNTPPNADCSSNGTEIANITNFTNGSWTDATGVSSGIFSYRACLYNSSNNLVQTYPVASVRAPGDVHTVFVTNNTWNGNFGGLAAMDAYCSTAAANAGLTADHYRAIASGTEINAKDRLDIRAPIYRRDGYLVATDATDLWDGSIAVPISVNEAGAGYSGTEYVWTGTTSAGITSGDCGGFRSSAFSSQRAGNAGRTDGYWLGWDTYYSCASNYRLFCLSQTGPRFSAITGNGAVGDISLTLTFPASTSHIGSVTIRRLAGDLAPNADCTSNGTQIASITNLTTQTFVDSTGVNSGLYSYRACTYSPTDILLSTFPFQQVRAKGITHQMFVTNGVFNGNLGGLSGADVICNNAASAAGIQGDGWTAVISDSSGDARDRLIIKGPILRMDGTLVAKSSADLWDSTLSWPINLTEMSTQVAGTSWVWTGTSPGGTNNLQNCSNWISSNTASGVYTGRVDSTSNTWTEHNSNVQCSNALHLFCVSKVGSAAPLAGFTGSTGTGSDGEIDLAFTYPGSTAGWARLDVRRLEGKTAPAADCSSTGSVVTSITNFSTTSYLDSGLNQGRIYSYRACAYGTDGYLIGSRTVSAVKAKGTNHRIFVTLASYNGNLGGLAGADAKCAAAATAAGQAGTFVALISTSSVDARSRYSGLNNPVYSTNNELIAVNQNDLFDGSILMSVSADEYGNLGTPAGTEVWSGSASQGSAILGNLCTDWTSTAPNGYAGRISNLDGGWFSYTYRACTNANRLYCISQ